MGGWFFSDYRVSPNFLLCWGLVVVEVGLGCDNCGWGRRLSQASDLVARELNPGRFI